MVMDLIIRIRFSYVYVVRSMNAQKLKTSTFEVRLRNVHFAMEEESHSSSLILRSETRDAKAFDLPRLVASGRSPFMVA